MREFGWTIPILIDDDGVIIAGHARVMAAQQLGIADIPVMIATGWSEAKKRSYMLADNKLALNAGWDLGLLKIEMSDLAGMGVDLGTIGFTAEELAAFIGGGPAQEPPLSVSLADRFGLPPFSVLNAREGWWQARKASWIGLGIQSELGRGENLLEFSDTILAIQNGKNPHKE